MLRAAAAVRRAALPRLAVPAVRAFSSEPAQLPAHISPEIKGLVDQISKLSLLQTADLVEALKITLKIPDAAMMPMGAMPAAMPGAGAGDAEGEGEKEAKQEKTVWAVKLEKFDEANKIKLIREIRVLDPSLTLVQAKQKLDSLPVVLKADASKEDADKFVEKAKGLGASIKLE